MYSVSHQVPSLFSSLGCLFASQSLLHSLTTLSTTFTVCCCRDVDARWARAFGMVDLLRLEAYLAVHQGVVSVTICAVVAACGEYTLSLGTPVED